MSNQDLHYFKTVLLQMQKELNDSFANSKESSQTVHLDQTSVGRLSRMDAMQSQAMAKENMRRRKLQLTRIEAALERIEEEEYGFCASCEEEINRKRLMIDPANPFCVICASQL